MPLARAPRERVDAQRERVCEWGKRWLRMRAGTCPHPAVVFDVDWTLVDGNGGRIEPVVRLYDVAGELGYARFIITARSSEGKRSTAEQLARLGIDAPRHAFFHGVNVPLATADDAAQEKERSRNKILKKRYTIVLNVGDAFGDHASGERRREIQTAVGDNSICAVYVNVDDGVAHLKLAHPK